MASATVQGSAHLEQACKDGIALLDTLLAHPGHAGQIEQLLKGANGLCFMNTVKAGVVLGVEHGSGFLISYSPSGKWSAPLFLNWNSAQAGAVLGVEKVSTLMVALTRAFETQLLEGGPVVGGDMRMQLLPIRSTSVDVEEKNTVWDASDLVSVSTGTGVMLDWSLSGGAFTVDATRNAECYGKEVGVRAVLSGEVERPNQILPLYEKIREVIVAAAPRG